RPVGFAECVEDLCLALLIAGLAGDVAKDLPLEALARDGKGRSQTEVRVFLLLRMHMMLEMIAPIGARLRHHRVGAEPLAEKGVELLVLCQHAMRPVMHQNGKAKLPRADHHDGEDIGERIWEGDENGHRPEDYA